jgi:hypothetical protein
MPSELTMDNTRNSVEPYLIGRLNDYEVFGLNEKAPHDDDGENGFLDVFQVHNFKQGLGLALYFAGIGATIAFFVGCFYGIKYLKNKFRSDDKVDLQKKVEEIKESMRENNEALLKTVDQSIKVIEPENLDADQIEARRELIDVKTRMAKDNIQHMVDSQLLSIDAMAAYHEDNRMQDIVDGLGDIQEVLRGDLDAVLNLIDGGVLDRLHNYNQSIIEIRLRATRYMGEVQKEQFSDAQETYIAIRQEEMLNERQLKEDRQGFDEGEIEHEPAGEFV